MILSISIALQERTICTPNAASQISPQDLVAENECLLCQRNVNETIKTGMEILFKINIISRNKVCNFYLNYIAVCSRIEISRLFLKFSQEIQFFFFKSNLYLFNIYRLIFFSNFDFITKM